MKHGHLPLRLLSYRPELNPMESVWGEIKTKIARQDNGSSSFQQKEHLLRKLFSEFSSPDMLIIHRKD